MQARFWDRSRKLPPDKTPSGDAAEVSMAEFTQLLAAMSRLLQQVSVLPVFKSTGIGLTEWVALSVADGKTGISGKALSKALGISGKRFNEVSAALSAAGLVRLSRTSEKQQTIVKVTESGKAKIAEINALVHPLLASLLGGKQRSMTSASKTIRMMTRLGQPASGGEKSR